MKKIFFKISFITILFVINQTNIQAQNCSAKINKLWTEYDVYQSGQQGIKVHCSFTTTGMRNTKWGCSVYVYENNKALVDGMGNDCLSYKDFYPQYQSTTYNDFILFISYNNLRSSLDYGNHNLKYKVGIDCLARHTEATDFFSDIVRSDAIYFSFNNPKPQTQYTQNDNQNYSQQTTYGIPPRSEWQNMIYIDNVYASHSAGMTHGVAMTVYKRKNYQGKKYKIYYKLYCTNSSIEFVDKRQFEGIISSSFDTDLKSLRYSNEKKPVVSLSDFQVVVTNVVEE